jgi:hypothetical protein
MARLRIATGVLIALTLAACGSATTKTVTIKEPKAKLGAFTRAVLAKQQVPKPLMRPCSTGVTANEHASCPFAERILVAYASATHEENGAVYLGVESPTTHKTYAVTCSHGGEKLVACRTTDAEVTLTFGAVIASRGVRRATTTPVSPRVITAYPDCPYGADAVTHEEEEGGYSSHCLKPNGAQETGEEEHRVEERQEKREEAEGHEPAWVKKKVEEREREPGR